MERLSPNYAYKSRDPHNGQYTNTKEKRLNRYCYTIVLIMPSLRKRKSQNISLFSCKIYTRDNMPQSRQGMQPVLGQ